jgi:hypothetical protein
MKKFSAALCEKCGIWTSRPPQLGRATHDLHEVSKLDSLAHMLTVAAVGARTVASKFSVIPLIKLVNGAAHELYTKPNCNAFAAGKA